MRTCIVYIVFLVMIGVSTQGYAQDLPGRAPNIETIPSGSYIIPMDDTYQSNGAGQYVLTAYGLVYALLNNDIPVKWVIKSGKERNDVDFSALCARKYPTELDEIMASFRHGAFVVSVDDLETNSCINGTSSSQNTVDDLIQRSFRAVQVYELRENVDVDVAHTLQFAPKIAVLTDGEWEEEHRAIFRLAGIPFTGIGSAEFFQDYSCYTYITQPHLEIITNSSYIPSLRDFLENGGNFLAQCSSVGAFENAGLFQTTSGVLFGTAENNNIGYVFSNNEMPIIQVTGEIDRGYYGTLSNYWLRGSSNYHPYSYTVLENQAGRTVMSVADVNGAVTGGNVIYLGGHGATTFRPAISGPSLQVMQMVLNGAFIPSNVAFACAGVDQCICEDDSVILGCSGASNSLVYNWSPSEGLSCTDCPNPIASPSTTMTYTLTVSNGPSGSCSQDEVTVNVIEVPEVDLLFEVCPGESVLYNGDEIFSGNTVQYIFQAGNDCDSLVNVEVRAFDISFDTLDFVSCDGSLIEYNGDMLPAGTLRDYIFTDTNGCDSTVTVRVRTFYSQALDFKVCSDDEIEYNGDTLEPGSTTVYTFKAEDGCDSIVTVRVNQTEIDADLNVEDVSCFGFDDGQIVASNPVGGVNPIQYSLDNINFSSDSTFVDLSPGDYQIYFLDANNCLDSMSFSINEAQDWSIAVSASEDTIIAGTTTTLFSSTDYIGTLVYSWSPSSTLFCADCPNPDANPIRTTTYTLTATDESGCVQTEDITIEVLRTMTFLPNVFTPNGDQINDTFFPEFRGEIESTQLSIFDRWGGLLYYSEDPYNNAWDGNYRGQPLMQGVYVYHIKTVFKSGYIENLSGDVTLLR